MSIIGKTFVEVTYHHGDFMWPFFKWMTISIFILIMSLFLYSYFIVYPEYYNIQPDNLFISGCLEIAKILKYNVLAWFIIPITISLFIGFIFAGIVLEITRWLIKTMIGDWFN